MQRNPFRSCSIFLIKFFKLADNKNCVNVLKKIRIITFKSLTKAVRLLRYFDFLKHINNFQKDLANF